jgi:hypothetical protein
VAIFLYTQFQLKEVCGSQKKIKGSLWKKIGGLDSRTASRNTFSLAVFLIYRTANANSVFPLMVHLSEPPLKIISMDDFPTKTSSRNHVFL